ncbi:MAG: HD domain-containing protein [Candidatus Aminicenantes bacterium]|nr:HD domain-containing protein [Candidatus Aminicenantes bacterium]
MEDSKIIEILRILEDISHIKDIDTLLEQVLFEARKIVNAEAGSVFLLKDDFLSFEYVQNDVLYGSMDNSNEYMYTKSKIPVDNKSIAGYAALTKRSLIIRDVYNIDQNKPYSFNRRFDKLSNYITKSVLTVPLINSREKVIGVFQIINSTDKNGDVIPFTEENSFLVELFAKQAALAIENAIMTREIIMRMISIAELRDPQETGAHVNRVGAYSVEIYKNWAKKGGVTDKVIKHNKDILRIAAMLHDVGKVAISDSILKKKGKLSEAEYEEMKFHTIYGARLFSNSGSEWDDMAKEITLNHHERWDGSGYPNGLKARHIPLAGRITAVADVFDALTSKRPYKKPFPLEKSMQIIEEGKGKHFDPEVVDSFFAASDEVITIKKVISNNNNKSKFLKSAERHSAPS